MAPLERSKVDLARRRGGNLVFLKNGNSPADLKELWTRLSPAVVALLGAMADEILTVGLHPGKLHIGDFVAGYFEARGIEAWNRRYA